MGINKPDIKKLQNIKFKIKVTKNGPYVVCGGIPLTNQIIVLDADGQCLEWRETERYAERENYSLCRCGKSRNLPFCDGSHIAANFDGTETASHRLYSDQCEKFTGPTLDLTDAKVLCADAGFCDRAGGTWNLISHSDDPKARQIAIEEACNCPSGRLVVWDKEGRVIEPVLELSIGLVESTIGVFAGPIWVRGGIPIESGDGEIYEIRNRIALCGCGRTSNKPFCNGSHRQKPVT
jgi:CDGSH-type Zn-finger protein